MKFWPTGVAMGVIVAGWLAAGYAYKESSKESEALQPPRENVIDYVRTAEILPYASGTKLLHFTRGLDGTYGDCIRRKEHVAATLMTTGCLYAHDNKDCCAGEPNPTPLSEGEYFAFTNHLLNHSLKEYFMSSIDSEMGKRNPD